MSERIERIEELLDDADPAAIELVRRLLELYGDGLARVMTLAGEPLAARLAADELIFPLLVLHDLHPLDTRARVESALAGHDADLTHLEDGLARLRVRGSGCRVTAAEQAVRAAAPEVERIEIEGTERPLIPIESLTVRRGAGSAGSAGSAGTPVTAGPAGPAAGTAEAAVGGR
ncbi:hypothetical protein [Nonomuraea sp. NPDC050643]|uniref:hypothetical protein n=1 Tax=Nonomuraea sp. NPDC050643 TaxID=3155660 RepID=UPI0034079E4F